MGNFFLKKVFTPLVYIQNDPHHGDHFEVCMLGYPALPPPPPAEPGG